MGSPRFLRSCMTIIAGRVYLLLYSTNTDTYSLGELERQATVSILETVRIEGNRQVTDARILRARELTRIDT